MRTIIILLFGMISSNLIIGQTLMISDAVTGIAFKPSDNVTFTRTISYTKIFKYEKAPDDSQNAGRTVKVFYPDRQNCIVESFKYLGPEHVYEFKSGDPELENKSASGQYDYYFEKKIIISISANGYEKGTINSTGENYYTGGSWPSKSYGHIKLVPLK
jgi:hypothetical protein